MIRVFLADDDEWILDRLKTIISWQSYGFEVVGEAFDGNMAYDKINLLMPDIVFTDIVMPGKSGLEILSHINKASYRMDVVILTGYAEFKYAQEACKLGAFDFLLKPLEKENLIDTLERLKRKYLIMHDQEDEQLIQPVAVKDTNNATLKIILHYIESNLGDNLHLYQIAEKYHFNASYISQLFKKELDTSFSEYVIRKRMDMAMKLLLETPLPIKIICQNVGISDYFYFNKLFKKYKGVTPSQLRADRKGLTSSC